MSSRSIRRAHARRIAKDQRREALRRRRASLIAGAAVGAATLAVSASAQADSFQVQTNADDNPTVACTAGSCATLRDAIAAANTAAAASTITFAPSLDGQSIVLINGSITIDPGQPLTITGPGSNELSVSGGGTSEVFSVSGTPAIGISGLTITDGNSGNTSAGGAIFNSSTGGLTLTDDAVTASTTADTTGGGGIDNSQTLTLVRTIVSGDTATAGPGGGIESSGRVTVEDSQLMGDTSSSRGGAIDWNSGTSGLSVTGSTISGNTAVDGGGIFVRNDTKYYASSQIADTTISGNTAIRGAGIDVDGIQSGRLLSIERSTLSGNIGGTDSIGGGLLAYDGIYGTIDVINSTISGNTATTGAGASLGYRHSTTLFKQSNGTQMGAIDFDNSTIAGNGAATAGHGGGLYLGDYLSNAVYRSGTVDVTSTIVSGNTSAGLPDDLDRTSDSTIGGFASAFSLVEVPGATPLSQHDTLLGISPQLGPLANNGGPTQTLLPAGTSPVIEQGHAPVSLAVDQRGLARTVLSGLPLAPGGDGTDIGAVELPASSVVLPPVPTPTPTPAPAPAPPFSVTLRGAPLGGGGTPLLVAGSTPVNCTIVFSSMGSCVIEVRAASTTTARAKTVAKGTLLASGEATAAGGATSLSTTLTLTSAGQAALKTRPLGLDGTAFAVGATTGAPAVTGPVHLLSGPSITLPTGSRSPKLSSAVSKQLGQAGALLAGARTVTCAAYTSVGTGDVALTQAQAKAACAALVKTGVTGKVTSTGKGHAHPVASNRTATGRAANRRIVITFAF
jgi:hypothetical protein